MSPEALERLAAAIERLAFQMPAPNVWTPQFAELASNVRVLARSLEQQGEAVGYISADAAKRLRTERRVGTTIATYAMPGDVPLFTHPAAVDEWRPISTAPKDGTAILAYWNPLPNWPYPNDGSNFAVTSFRYGQWRPAGDDDDTEWDTPPLWRPLPAPPAALQPATEGENNG